MMRALAHLTAFALAVACSAAPRDDVLEDLRGVPGLTVEEEMESLPGTRFFRLRYEQPVDHTAPDGPHFPQRLTLLLRTRAAPVVLQLSGYFVTQRPDEIELTGLVGASQLSVEHRHFGPSRPDPPRWDALTVAQAAADGHRVVAALRPILGGRWISTGTSKGGIAALAHRRLYPSDVSGTVAYVTPLMTERTDPRFVSFLETVGEPSCRARLAAFQRDALERRTDLQAAMSDWASGRRFAFTRLGLDRAFEIAVLEMPFAFWQARGDCDQIPASRGAARAAFDFLESTTRIGDHYSDGSLDEYAPSWLQNATELGSPQFPQAHLAGLLRSPSDPAAFVPAGVNAEYRPAAMKDLEQWLSSEARGVALVYGERDPWSAAAISLADGALRFFARDRAHEASIAHLSGDERARIESVIDRWVMAR